MESLSLELVKGEEHRDRLGRRVVSKERREALLRAYEARTAKRCQALFSTGEEKILKGSKVGVI